MTPETTNAAANITTKKKKQKKLYPFVEARKIARGHGFSTKEEFLEYTCPGAYQLPKNPDELWAEEGWNGWEDFLGIPFATYEEAKSVFWDVAVKRGTKEMSKEEYMQLISSRGKGTAGMEEEDEVSSLLHRLPHRPDLFYKSEWKGWEDWLGRN